MKVYVVIGAGEVQAVCSSFEKAQEWINRAYKSDTPVEHLPSIETWLVDHFVH